MLGGTLALGGLTLGVWREVDAVAKRGQAILPNATGMAAMAARWQETVATVDAYDVVSIVLYIASAGLLTAGIVTFIVVDEDVEPDEDAARLQYIAPTVLDGGAGLSMGFSF